MSDSMVAQLHHALLDAMRRSRPASLHRPVTVAEIYQDLVPYKTARTSLGFDINADYEHTLLRLLAGEGDFARIEPTEVREKLRLELESPNPDVGMFRNYAACDVWVSVDASDGEAPIEDIEDSASWEEELVGSAGPVSAADIRAALEADDDDEVIEFVADEDENLPTAVPHYHSTVSFELDEDDVADVAEPAAKIRRVPAEQREPVNCVFCGGDLPAGKMVNYCPFCGSDQSQQPCPSCGELLEPLWRFCVSCGVRVRPLGDHVN